jgi:hypothetical protein
MNGWDSKAGLLIIVVSVGVVLGMSIKGCDSWENQKQRVRVGPHVNERFDLGKLKPQ